MGRRAGQPRNESPGGLTVAFCCPLLWRPLVCWVQTGQAGLCSGCTPRLLAMGIKCGCGPPAPVCPHSGPGPPPPRQVGSLPATHREADPSPTPLPYGT